MQKYLVQMRIFLYVVELQTADCRYFLDAARLSPEASWTLLGAGVFGSVHACALDGAPMCVKRFHASHEDVLAAQINEFALVNELGAVNVAHLSTHCVFAQHFFLSAADELLIAFEWQNRGSLQVCACKRTRARACL